MVSSKSKVMVSNHNYEFNEVSIDDIENKHYGYAMSLNTRSKTYTYNPILNTQIYKYSGQMIKLSFVNNQNIQYDLFVKPNCGFITKRGVINASKINELDVFFDKGDNLCKVFSKTNIVVENEEIADICVQYTYNYFCNGILIRGKR